MPTPEGVSIFYKIFRCLFECSGNFYDGNLYMVDNKTKWRTVGRVKKTVEGGTSCPLIILYRIKTGYFHVEDSQCW